MLALPRREEQNLRLATTRALVKVGSSHAERDDFPLTRDRKAKFTEKLGQNPRDLFGRKVG
jgi:hypothetical protein